MTLVLDMATGEEHRDEELSLQKQNANGAQSTTRVGHHQLAQMRLATIDPTASLEQAASSVPYPAIDSLLKSIED